MTIHAHHVDDEADSLRRILNNRTPRIPREHAGRILLRQVQDYVDSHPRVDEFLFDAGRRQSIAWNGKRNLHCPPPRTSALSPHGAGLAAAALTEISPSVDAWATASIVHLLDGRDRDAERTIRRGIAACGTRGYAGLLDLWAAFFLLERGPSPEGDSILDHARTSTLAPIRRIATVTSALRALEHCDERRALRMMHQMSDQQPETLRATMQAVLSTKERRQGRAHVHHLVDRLVQLDAHSRRSSSVRGVLQTWESLQ